MVFITDKGLIEYYTIVEQKIEFYITNTLHFK